MSSKLALAFGVFLLISATLSMYPRTQKEVKRNKLKSIAQTVINNLEKADHLPGEVKIKKRIPDLDETFEIFILSSRKDNKTIVKVEVSSEEKISRNVILNKKLSKSSSYLSEINPTSVFIEKSERINIEVT